MDSIFRFGLENGFANMERKGKREKRERKRLAIIRKKKEKKQIQNVIAENCL